MRLLELFSGTGNLSRIARERGWDAVTVDLTEPADIRADVRFLPVRGSFDLVWASPPCEAFSKAAHFKGWEKVGDCAYPTEPRTKEALALVLAAVGAIHDLAPRYWMMENPTGILRKAWVEPDAEIWQCQYGATRAKPTDLWGRIPPGFEARRCHNYATDHAAAPRGSKTPGSTQGTKGYPARSRLPDALCHAVLRAVEIARNSG